ncbi:heterokaryon incompatibility protein-domain-containing protein [Pseudoneurospora amorphoporcata]|uniref:Heterokaryon incompatibility protein-domain-containing protein n=1 Tax=Pseudoneurospora amorphoporcata TaxID=241081 RepID=A0AAN6SK72_9PEZI|nr:heterokaryon incompatibility protein-domain-containing protein [Pseudoneurospora amorphoporcata]
MTLEEVAATLPRYWQVEEAWDGRTTWVHPADSFHHSRYQKPARITRPEYEALSYTWGSNEFSQKVYIWMDTQDTTASALPLSFAEQFKGGVPPCHTYLRITRNLETALRNLRDRDYKRILWADGICINQSDTDDKNKQVPRMGDIFRRAQRVVSWLSPDEKNSGHALKALEYLGKQVVYTRRYAIFGAPEATEPQWYQRETELPYNGEIWMAIVDLLSRQWFYRQWIVQEVQLAEDAILCCGQSSINWTYFRYALTSLRDRKYIPPSISRGRLVVNGLCEPYHMNSPFRGKIRPNYDKSHTAVQVYKETFLAHTYHFQRLELLTRCYLSKWKVVENKPSWVPDLSYLPTTISMPIQFAAGFSRCWTKISSDSSDIFTVAGIQCATVKTIGSPLPAVEREDDALLAIRELAAKELAANTGQYPETTSYPYWKTWLRQESAYAFFDNNGTGHVVGDKGGPSSHEYVLMNLLNKRRYVTTEEGYIGIGPPDVEEGDLVCVILGDNKPVILRPQQLQPQPQPPPLLESSQFQEPFFQLPRPSPPEDTGFLFVGPCSVYGIDNANGLLGPLPKPWRVQAFRDGSGLSCVYKFFNPNTGVLADEDPRLPPLDGNKWERVSRGERTGDDPFTFQRFRNKLTGEVINYDPRMDRDALEGQGIPIRDFNLV